ncbi:hypothetical protein [Priestia megaterium]|uniref:hypothetical protein n=1 Tax=Priestia megaterium TaxID=1404 RepID=UPI0012D896A0|nr:hypothetical protein [Priestia megaterium]MUL33939.1 hypothetical protein [Priestia megaterium]
MGRSEAEFLDSTKKILAKRVGERCSNPSCRKLTSRPHPLDISDYINVGEAAHIRAASEKGPRYDPNMTDEQRKNITNGIWLCQQCHKVVDDKKLSEDKAITVDTLLYWKEKAEISTAQEAAYLEGNYEKYDWVIETLNSTKAELNGFVEKWSSMAAPKFNSGNVHKSVMDSVRYNTEKQNDFNTNILEKVEKITILSRYVLEEGNPLLTEVEVSIRGINENKKETIIRLEQSLEKLVKFITTQ